MFITLRHGFVERIDVGDPCLNRPGLNAFFDAALNSCDERWSYCGDEVFGKILFENAPQQGALR